MSRTILIFCVFLAACGNETALEHQSLRSYEPPHTLTVLPTELLYDTLAKDESAVGVVTIRATGEVPVVVEGLRVTGAEAFGLAEDVALPRTVAPGDAWGVRVHFAPTAPYKRSGTLVVRTDVPGKSIEVALSGRGAPPEVVLPELSMGEVAIGCATETADLRVENDGGQDLKVFEMTTEGDPQLHVDPLDVIWTIAPSRFETLGVAFAPVSPGEVLRSVSFRTNDLSDVWHSVDVRGTGVYAYPRVEESFIVEPRAVDILLAVDRSQSMDDDVAQVSTAFEEFVAQLPEQVPAFQLGVVTGVSPCFNGGLFTNDTADFEDGVLWAMRGEGSPLTEALLDLALDALEVTESCNAGFLRPGVPLQLIVVSDEPEQSSIGWEPLLDDMGAFLFDHHDLHVSGVVDVDRRCGAGADGYLEAAEATDGVMLDLCDASLSGTIHRLLEPSQMGVDLFPLRESPLIDTLIVEVDGVRTTSFTYDLRRDAIRLDETPAVGAAVEVGYRSAGCP